MPRLRPSEEAGPRTRRVAVTGGAGFIGSHVADAFLARGREVLVLDDLSSGSVENVPRAASFEQLDIVDSQALAHALAAFRPAAVCHLAAQASVTASVREPERDLSVNVRGTFNVLEAARDLGAPVVFASTGGALYGEGAQLPSPETTWAEPLSPYGASKLAAEAYVRTWGALHGIANVVLRLANVYGPRQNPHGEAGVVAIFSDRLREAETPVVYGDGRQTRDYIYVGDVAGAFVLAAESGLGEIGSAQAPGDEQRQEERPREGPRARSTFNVGTARETSVLELLALLQELAGTSLEPAFEPLRAGELTRSALDSARLREALGWEPRVDLKAGLELTYRSYAATNSKGSESAISASRGA
jgi:UDP-glucose 4-epimerase